MKFTKLILLLTILAGALILSACGASEAKPTAPLVEKQADSAPAVEQIAVEDADAEHSDNDEHAADVADAEHEHVAPPNDYVDKTNPFNNNPDAIAAGAKVYSTFCSSCHGPEGKGDGPAAEALNPKPANFTDGEMMQNMTDGYLFWRVSEGGMMEPFNSVMPAWKQGLTEEQRWQAISFIKTLAQ